MDGVQHLRCKTCRARDAACEAPMQASFSRHGDCCLRQQRRDAYLLLDGQPEQQCGFFSTGVLRNEDFGRDDFSRIML